MDQDLKVYLDEQFTRMDEQFARMDERFEKVDERFEKLEDEVNLSRIVTEGLRDDLRQVADGVAANTERLEKLQRHFEDSHTKLEARVTRLEAAKRTTLRTTRK